LSPGIYKVSWRVVSVDTHATDGTFTFTIAGG
jgi:methionine-rich copper-binding protein CopC